MSHKEWLIRTDNLEPYREDLQEGFHKISAQRIIERIWAKDWTVWKEQPVEIADRLGWLTSPEDMAQEAARINEAARSVREEGFTRTLLLGMGGSSLAPEVFSSVFMTKNGYVNLDVLDSTDPGAVLKLRNSLDPARTIFIVSSKSGTTVETTSFLNFFYTWVCRFLGEREAGRRFIAITDPRTPLEETAFRLGFRAVFQGRRDIGGRFSALSAFGLVPAALKGVDIEKLLANSRNMAGQCRIPEDPRENPGACLGTILGVLAQKGVDKATFFISPGLESFGAWAEQLIAESTGKEGQGILPVVDEPAGLPEAYGRDRLFIFLENEKDESLSTIRRSLSAAGFPQVSIIIKDPYDLGGHFFLWEFAVAVAGFHLGINPFDQPDVDAAKKAAQKFLKAYKEHGAIPAESPQLTEAGIALYADHAGTTLKDSLSLYFNRAQKGDYIAIQAFLTPNPEMKATLRELCAGIRNRTKLSVTYSFGPRYLHSTGQLHKGDRGNGLFLQLTGDDAEDVSIPDSPGSDRSSLSFGILKSAQARGDFEALKARGRRTLRLHFQESPLSGLKNIASRI